MGSDENRREWQRVHAMTALASNKQFDPDALLDALRDLRSIEDSKKHRALDQLGKILVEKSIERPTLEECRGAIEAKDPPAPIHEWFKEASSDKTIEALVVFMLQELGGAEQTVSGANAPAIDRSDWRTFTASSAERKASTAGRVETESCVVETSRDSTFFPGDVNEPPWEREYIVIDGKRRDGSCSIRVSFHNGDRELSLNVSAKHAERDQILRKFWRTFT